jgi:hypothetical protein
MVIAWSKRKDEGGFAGLSAWQAVEKAQAEIHYPCLLVPQPSHAVLAGELAEALLPEVFGELSNEVLQAITMHDTGWAPFDAAEIQRLRSNSLQGKQLKPAAFLFAPPQETVEAWRGSIQAVERLSILGALIVSEHFTTLAKQEIPEHKRFAAQENRHQQELKEKLQADTMEVTRGTGALRFCDLLSLYLLTGLRVTTVLPLIQNSLPDVHSTKQVELSFDGDRIHCDPQIFRIGAEIGIQALKHPLPANGSRVETLQWEIV